MRAFAAANETASVPSSARLCQLHRDFLLSSPSRRSALGFYEAGFRDGAAAASWRGERTGQMRTDWQKTFSEMSDEQILLLASDPSSLREEARPVLSAELGRRRLKLEDILEYKSFVEEVKPGQMRGSPYLAWEIWGCGISTYGQCDFDTSGAFVTTKWFVLFYIPLIPLRSFRIAKSGKRIVSLALLYIPLLDINGEWELPPDSKIVMRCPLPLLAVRTPYLVREETRPNWKQAARIYGFAIGLPIICLLCLSWVFNIAGWAPLFLTAYYPLLLVVRRGASLRCRPGVSPN